MKFINRKKELQELDKWVSNSSLIVVYGRRRIGKTKMLTHWLGQSKKITAYSQAIEGSRSLQLAQIIEDFNSVLKTQLQANTWMQFFELIEKSITKPTIFCIDEFPYLVESDPSLPSLFQKWWDHKKNKNIAFILCGSSQKMMHSFFLKSDAPLYNRANRVFKIEPMSYVAFCQASGLKYEKIDSFVLYSMVGGIPKYWEYVSHTKDPIELAEILYFQSGSIFESEPRRILSDEKVEGLTPISVLECIGRGAHRPSEISSRMQTQQNSLSKIFTQLMDASLIVRETPFGSPLKDSKKSLYKINDAMLNFWYSVYSNLRSQWTHLSNEEKYRRLYHFASQVFEQEARRLLQGQRYWSNKVEVDCIVQKEKKSVFVFEIKFSELNQKEKNLLELNVSHKLENLPWTKEYNISATKIFDWNDYTVLIKS